MWRADNTRPIAPSISGRANRRLVRATTCGDLPQPTLARATRVSARAANDRGRAFGYFRAREEAMRRLVPFALSLAACVSPPDGAATEQALSVCPAAATVAGVDTSSWQGAIDWTAVAQSGRAFAIARVSDGLTYPDAQFATDWPAIRSAGMIRGAYQFFRASQDPIAQADLLAAAIGGPLGDGDLPAILDLETSDGEPASVVIARAQAWLDRAQARTGKTPMVYTAAFMSSVIGSSFARYPLWVANYGVSCPRLPDGWSAWRIWQSGDSGRVPGISGGVDVDVFDGTLDELRAFAGASWSCSASAYGGAQYWTCSGGALHECVGGAPVERACDYSCVARAVGQDDLCVNAAPGWSCASSAYSGAQYWTCSGGSLYRCAGVTPETIACPNGCVSHPLGSDDTCR
jgi:lysozyme